jgi:hypothetical protein
MQESRRNSGDIPGTGQQLHFFRFYMVHEPSTCMDYATVKKWVTFFIGILSAIVIADVLSDVIVSAVGMSGWINFLVNFLLYAVFFFAALYAIEKIFNIEFFGFWKG